MPVSETIAAIVFYLGVAALVVGAILSARRAIEHRRDGSSRVGIGAIVVGLVAIVIAVSIFATGPRGVLPF